MDNRDVIVLTAGPNYSGKTEAAVTLAKFGFSHFSTRELVENDPKLKEIIASGGVISDEVMIPLLNAQLPAGGWVNIDSPRSLAQVQWLMAKRYQCHRFRVVTVFLSASEKTVLRRLAHRMQTKPGRLDDNFKAAMVRMDHYESYAPPMLDFLRRRTEFHQIDANLSLAQVSSEVQRLALHLVRPRRLQANSVSTQVFTPIF